MSAEGSASCRKVQHRAREILGEEEVGAAAHDEDRLGQSGKVQAGQL